MPGRRKRLLVGNAKRQAVKVVAAGVINSPNTSLHTLFNYGDLEALGVEYGDILIVSCPYDGYMNSLRPPADGGGYWNITTGRYVHSWMYTAYQTAIQFAPGGGLDKTNRYDINSPDYGPITWAIFRGAGSAEPVGNAYANNTGSTVSVSVPAETAAGRLALVACVYDRDGTFSMANVAASGYTNFISEHNSVFGAAMLLSSVTDKEAHTLTITGFPAVSFGQGAFVWELRP